MNAPNTHAGVTEAMLLRWSDNHNGRTVTFQLPADGEHPFRGLKCGPTNGQRMALSVALIADDETEHPKPNGSEKPKSYAQRAALLCKEPAFWRFYEQRQDFEPHRIGDEATMIDFLRLKCGVSSRSEIIEGTEAGRRFRDLVAEYEAWKKL